MNIPCILFPILAGLGGLFFGWLIRGTKIKELKDLLGHRTKQVEDLTATNETLEKNLKEAEQTVEDKQRLYDTLYTDFGKLNIEKRQLKRKIDEQAAEIEGMNESSTSLDNSTQITTSTSAEVDNSQELDSSKTQISAETNTNPPASTQEDESTVTNTATGSEENKDDLKKVEGIGPKIEELLNNAGIWSYADLANASVDQLMAILTEAGPRYQSHQPNTWPRQAAMARDGKWTELEKWQDELDGGKETI